MNSKDVKIRPLDLDDLDALLSIEREAQQTPWTQSTLLECFSSHSRMGLGIVSENTLVGFVWVSIIQPEAEILEIAISPKYQGQGLGRQLLKKMFTELEACGIQQVFLEVRASNQVAIGLYQSVGFKIIGRRKNYYSVNNGAQKEDAIIMNQKLQG